MRYLLACSFFVVTFLAAARGGAADPGDQLLDALLGRTPGATLDQMRGNPKHFLQEAAGLILGYGDADGIGPAGIETAIQVERARVRAREIRRLLEADLNGDLAVSSDELAVQISAASATMRGRVLIWHGDADTDQDGNASWAEIRQFAQARAAQALNQKKAEQMLRLMLFDLDENGQVSVAEVRRAITMLGLPS